MRVDGDKTEKIWGSVQEQQPCRVVSLGRRVLLREEIDFAPRIITSRDPYSCGNYTPLLFEFSSAGVSFLFQLSWDCRFLIVAEHFKEELVKIGPLNLDGKKNDFGVFHLGS